jgi:hypothetical protein
MVQIASRQLLIMLEMSTELDVCSYDLQQVGAVVLSRVRTS